MTPEELRADIPALRERSYLNYGAHGPSPEYVVDAAASFLADHEYGAGTDDPYDVAFDTYETVRERIAAFLGAAPEEIALTESTTDGINRIANAFEWAPGDTVVRTDVEHPAGILPWQRLEREGIDVRVVETTEGRIDTDAFADAVADAKLACFSAITWTHGTRLPVRELAEIAADADTFTLVDAVQTPGQRAIDVSEWGADAVVAAGHKWLLGPWGAGFLYLDRDRAAELVPRSVGYRSVTSRDPDIEFKPGAPRLEIGSTSPAPHVGLVEAMNAIEEVGIDRIERRIESLTDRLKDGIDDDRLVSPREYHSGLVSIDVEEPSAVVDRLAERDVVVRSLPSPDVVRVSVHGISTESEIDAVLDVVGDAR
jgi:selenocysteine lyase/cysteine desulfurase